MATAVSRPIAGESDLVWLMIPGSPSGGKTTTVSAIRGPLFVYIDNLTENALASGYVPKGRMPKKENLLARLQDTKAAALVIKDLTTLFSKKEDKVKEIIGDLVSIYDGEYTKWTGTVGQIRYEARFAIVACVTPTALEEHYRYMSHSEAGSSSIEYRRSPPRSVAGVKR
jgi:hypothetical protein